MRTMRNKIEIQVLAKKQRVKDALGRLTARKHKGINGILVTIGLCIIALLLCVVMKDSLTVFIQTIVTSMTNKAQTILG